MGAAQRELLGMVQLVHKQPFLVFRPDCSLVITEDPEKYHRYVEIVYRDANESKVNVAGEGKFLTDRVYLVPARRYSHTFRRLV